MASSSTSSIQKSIFKYDVFLSFRGEDTRNTFVDHLYDALKREGIKTYKDDIDLEQGKEISKELIQAIEDSRYHVIVFSKDYASSSWCLKELVKIMECQHTTSEQTVYPIFYHVEPTEVRNQIGEFGKAFAKHEKAEAAKMWRNALVQATSFSGWDLKNTNGKEVEFIKIVVNEISLKLPSISAADDNLVGMTTRINHVVSSLYTSPDEPSMIGIWGMGGIGKTTLAGAVFDHIRKQFEGSSFVENVRERSNSLGLNSLQQQVLRDVLNRQDITVNGVFEGKRMLKKYMQCKKVLVVLDDVDRIEQLQALAGEPNWFMKGSKIIITTRDRKVLETHKVVKPIHDARLLSYEEAICLLSRCAFGTDTPISGYAELSKKVVSYAAGLPITITTLGLALYGVKEDVWKETLEELEKIPLDETLQMLELSYKGLDPNCKKIFLDVACILKGWKKDEAIRVLESCGFPAERGLSVLEKRSLITISHDNNLGMHDRIEEMGKHVVRSLHDPSQHSRLWIKKEIIDILANNRGTEATECIKLVTSLSSDIKPETIMKGLGSMEKLRFLLVRILVFNRLELDEASQFPNSLQYLEWYRYPFRSLPGSFQASNLVALEMPNSRIEQLWGEGKREVLDKLRFLQLSGSNLRTLDFLGLTPNLETLDLQRCYNVVKFDIPVGCQKLRSLKLGGNKLSTLDLILTPNIGTLDLDQCVDLVELCIPRKCPQLKILNLKGCRRLVKLDIPWECPQLRTLNLEECCGLVKLNMPWDCPQLREVDMRGCQNLGKLYMPRECPQLEKLFLMRCEGLEKLVMPNEFPQLITLNLEGCCGLVKLNMPWDCPQLREVNLCGCQNLGELYMPRECPQLITLNANHGCEKLLELHMPRECPQLENLFLMGCEGLEKLVMPNEFPQLKSLKMSCPRLRSLVNINDFVLPKLEYLNLCHSKSRTFELTLNLKRVRLDSCDLEEFHIPDEDVKLVGLYIYGCSKLKTLDLKRTPNLSTLELTACYNLVTLHAPVGGLEKLIYLKYFRINGLQIMGDKGILPVLDMSETLVDISQLTKSRYTAMDTAHQDKPTTAEQAIYARPVRKRTLPARLRD